MEKGLYFVYRPTRFDFREMDGQPLYERLIGFLLDKIKLALCIHATFGRASYAEILEHYGDRVELAYFMDSLSLPDGAARPVPLGEGDHNWQPILRACTKAGVKHIFVAQESRDRSFISCTRASMRYLSQLGLE